MDNVGRMQFFPPSLISLASLYSIDVPYSFITSYGKGVFKSLRHQLISASSLCWIAGKHE
jgi:hypothetical protein